MQHSTHETIQRPLPRGRGRPRNTKPLFDTGTPELVYKRLHGLTQEGLDLLLDRRLISDDQHRAGLRLRWLYTMKHGVTRLRALDLACMRGLPPQHDEEWSATCEAEYHDAIAMLRQSACEKPVFSLCVFDDMPPVLRHATRPLHPLEARYLSAAQRGLALLVTRWFRAG
jgi:hypothetical protein